MNITKRNIAYFFGSLLCIIAITFLSKAIRYLDTRWLKIAALVCANFLNGLTTYAAMKLTGMQIAVNWKNKQQYGIGVTIALSLSAVIAVIPARLGFSLVGSPLDFSWFTLVYDFLLYLLVIGPVEEFVFRVYLQDALVSFFPRHKWIGVVIGALLFGLWHIINGSLIQVFLTFGIGLAFGFAKYKINGCTYVSVAFGHGLYDFFNTLVRMFLV